MIPLELPKDLHDELYYYRKAGGEIKRIIEEYHSDCMKEYGFNKFIQDITEPRIKEDSEISRKIERRKISPEEVYDKIEDLVGVRVVCLNLAHIYHVAHFILSNPKLEILDVKDYIKQQQDNGYRSLHLILSIPVYKKGKEIPYKVEIQIRTMVEDMWATLSHRDQYKDREVDEDFRKLMVTISNILNSADEQADILRKKANPNEKLKTRKDCEKLYH